MTFDEFVRKVTDIIPSAVIGEDNAGQLVIYTDLRELPSGELVSIEEER